MAFGWPTLYWQLDPSKVEGGVEAWDRAVLDASDEYKGRMVCFCSASEFIYVLHELVR